MSFSLHFLFLLSLLCGSCAGLVQRCVIIQKDDNGFGLTVSGDNPVFVQSVKEGKAFFLKTVLSLGNRVRTGKLNVSCPE